MFFDTSHVPSCWAHNQRLDVVKPPSATGRSQGLSGMQGNLHVPFLGGWAGAIPPGYPAMGRRTVRQRALCLPSGSLYNPTFVTLSSLKPFFFNGLKNE
jgi:hypothetical protein